MKRYRLKKSLRDHYDHSPPLGTIAHVEPAHLGSLSTGMFFVETLPSADYLGQHHFVMNSNEVNRYFEEIIEP